MPNIFVEINPVQIICFKFFNILLAPSYTGIIDNSTGLLYDAHYFFLFFFLEKKK